MRQGSVPWAVEMKVRGGGGVGGYYRHAVGQAVLYRQFIRSASPWTRGSADRDWTAPQYEPRWQFRYWMRRRCCVSACRGSAI